MGFCNVCGGLNGHLPGCPEAPQPKPINTCHECGGDIYAGDTVFKLETTDGIKYLCCECCSGPFEAEDDGYTYEDYLEWRQDMEEDR